MSRRGPRRWARIEDVIDRDETGELDRARVREALGEAGQRDTGHSGERIDPSRDREARERLEEPPPAGDRDQGGTGAPTQPVRVCPMLPSARGGRPRRPRLLSGRARGSVARAARLEETGAASAPAARLPVVHMTETLLAYRKPGADQTDAGKGRQRGRRCP